MKNFLLVIALQMVVCYSGLHSQSQLKKIVDLSIAPVSAFKNSCSRCHGDEGSAYGKGFADMRDDSLRSIVEDMMFGPGGLNPDSAEVNAMIAYNKSLKSKTPFAAALNSKSFLEGKSNYLQVEVSPDTKLEVADTGIKIDGEQNVRRLYFDPQKVKTLEITVKKNNFTAGLNFPAELWTR